MISIEVNADDKKVHCTCEVNIEGTKRMAIAEFAAVLDGLYKSDKLILALALKELMEEKFDYYCAECIQQNQISKERKIAK